MDDYDKIIEEVRNTPKINKGNIPTHKPQQEEPEDYDSIIKAVRSPASSPISVNGTSSTEAPQTEYEVPGFSGYKAHPEVAKIAMEYYGKATPQEALDAWVNDQTWNNANAAMALVDAVKAQTVDPIKAKQMAFLGDEFEKLPAFWEGDRPLTEKATRLWANVWRGVVDPLTWAGGAVGGKVASTVIGKGAGILSRAAGAAAADVAAGATAETSQQVMKQSVGRQEEISVPEIAEAAGVMGLTGGAIRGGAGLLKRIFTKPEVKPPAPPSKIANDNPIDEERARINARLPENDQSNAKGILNRIQQGTEQEFVPPELANQNKYPEMERTTPIKEEVDSGILKRPNEDDGMRFNELEHLNNDLEEPYVKPIRDSGLLQESEPLFGQKNPLLEDIESATRNAVPEEPIPFEEPLHIKHNEALQEIEPPKEENILKRKEPPPPPPIKETKKDEPSPLLVELLDKITGKAHGLTYLNDKMESWPEIIRASEANKGYEDVRPKVTKQQVAAEVEQMGLNVPEVFENLSKMTGITDGPRLHQVMYAGIMESKKEALNTHTLASNFNEALMKFGRGSKEADEAMVAYAQMRQYFMANMKAFAGSRSEVGRALSMLRPNENIETQINKLAKELKENPEGLKSENGNILCG